VIVHINGQVRTDVECRSLKLSFIGPHEALLEVHDAHDTTVDPHPRDLVEVYDDAGTKRFYGWIVEVQPRGIFQEGLQYVARGRRWRLENETVRINGSSLYVWNRRGSHCTEGLAYDSPNSDGSRWTIGQIIIDILEHAAGVPGGGSDISGHHADGDDVTNTYLDGATIASYTPADILAIDDIIGEFSVSNTRVADAIQSLLDAAGGMYGWFIAADGELVIVDMSACDTVDLAAGEAGHWQDEAGKNYRLLDNRLAWSLDGVYSHVCIQGYDDTTEEKPANLDGGGNSSKGDAGELELVGVQGSWYVYRAAAQPKRLWTSKPVSATPPAGWMSWVDKPRLYRGEPGGAKTVVNPALWFVHLDTGLVYHSGDPGLTGSEKLWGWYWARTPFQVCAGPDGNAYDNYGHEATLSIYDPAFRSTTSWPPGLVDDETAMELLAASLLEKYKDVRVQGQLVVDGLDFGDYGLQKRYNVTNLQEGTTTVPPGDPWGWATLAINAVEVLFDAAENATTITVANTFTMLEGYSELKRRMKDNELAKRELALSEDIVECQITASTSQGSGVEQTTTTTAEPTTTTTTTPEPTTTTPEPGTTTEEPATTTPEPPVTTTAEPPTCLTVLTGASIADCHITFTRAQICGTFTVEVLEEEGGGL